MIKVRQGGEYTGETYIWCTEHCAGEPVTTVEADAAMFQGGSLDDLMAFIGDHEGCGGDQGR